MRSKPLFLSVATPEQIEYALQNYRKKDGGKAASVSCLISGDPGESVPITLFDGKSFGYVLDETKVDCPHAEFYARNTGGLVPRMRQKDGSYVQDVSKQGYKT